MNRLSLLMLLCLPLGSLFASVFPEAQWEKAPTKQMAKWSEEGLAKAKAYWKELGSTAFMVIEDGRVICEWGDSTRPVNCNSVRKSFMSALYGIGVDRGEIDLSETLADLGIDDKEPALSSEEKEVTIQQLLKARSGIYHHAAYETKTMRKKRPARGSHAPGTFWFYNNWDFNVLSTIFKQKTGVDTFKAFQERIAVPIGMEQFSLKNTKYRYDDVSEHPAYLFYMSTRDRARFGLLFLNQGKWKGKQIISKDWVEESTTSYSDTGRSGVGYGYLWWVSTNGWHFRKKFSETAYSARGNHGQYIVVIPSMNVVVAHSVDKRGGDKMRKGKKFSKLFRLALDARDSR